MLNISPFPKERVCMHDSLASNHERGRRKERKGVGAKNGLRRRQLSQESRIPRQQGIKQICVNYFNE